MSINIIVPTYKRLDNIYRTAEQLKDFRDVIFVCHESDQESINAVLGLGNVTLTIDYQSPSGVNATNAGFKSAWTDLVVIGQDDFLWHDGWLKNALKKIEEGYKVVGFNDAYPGHAQAGISVGWLVDRHYVNTVGLTPDTPGVIFYPGYQKLYSDTELCEYNRFKGVYAVAENAILEHLHPSFGKSESDETYTRLEVFEEQDKTLFHERKRLYWN